MRYGRFAPMRARVLEPESGKKQDLKKIKIYIVFAIFCHFLSKIYITYTKFTMYILLKKWQKVSKFFVVNRSHLFGGQMAGPGRAGSGRFS